MRLMFAARGWNAPTLAMLVGASCGAVALGQVSVELRSGTDFISAVQVLDRMVLVGLALPIAVIVRQLEDRAAWAFATSARDRFRDRAVYLATVIGSALACGACIALTYAQDGFALLVFADVIFLLSLGIAGAVVTGAQLAWVPPVVAALVCSTPGLVPITANLLVLPERWLSLMIIATGMLLTAACMFVALDDYGLSRTRLLSRGPGITDE